jgi:DnaJ like chaperone protein
MMTGTHPATEMLVRWIGGGLGWILGGPSGGVFGFIAGAVIDNLYAGARDKATDKTAPDDFAVSLLTLIAAVTTAEGQPQQAEQNYVRHFLRQNFGEKEAKKAFIVLCGLQERRDPVENACKRVYRYLDYPARQQLVRFLFDLAGVHRPAGRSKQDLLHAISSCLGVNIRERMDIPFPENAIDAAYALLEIDRNATVPEIRKAYRHMALKYHPDKVAYLGDDAKTEANGKFQQLNSVYELIKKERNFS